MKVKVKVCVKLGIELATSCTPDACFTTEPCLLPVITVYNNIEVKGLWGIAYHRLIGEPAYHGQKDGKTWMTINCLPSQGNRRQCNKCSQHVVLLKTHKALDFLDTYLIERWPHTNCTYQYIIIKCKLWNPTKMLPFYYTISQTDTLVKQQQRTLKLFWRVTFTQACIMKSLRSHCSERFSFTH